ncbi:hypothetical protein LZ198_14160 [Myxococcus sp. K15C18031901]|uniref:hypothetical protein n=1 Tax=Myxococcus dinghuensis TaxID=2906761 RepID=UPI0020A82583|nr:hypothetical protein [Myxococcus dinghuensis]MCP3100016.1 hypothetical protein [Myxococcus dinghuensis]
MASTTEAKPRILYTGAPTGEDLPVLRQVGELTTKNGKDGLEQAEVLWVDCATSKPDQYGALLRAALDAGKTLVLNRPDAPAHAALSGLVSLQVEDGAQALLVSRDTTNNTPAHHIITALGGAVTEEPAAAPHSGGDLDPAARSADGARQPAQTEDTPLARDWARVLETHRRQSTRSVGGPGLIPPSGVMFGISTLSRSFPYDLTNSHWTSASGKRQSVEASFTSSFYVYRENGKSSPDYVVIRVQEATFDPGSRMLNINNAKGCWQYEFQTECTNNRGVQLIANSPGTTNGPGLGAQVSLPLYVKYVQEGSCTPNYWSASHGPVPRSIEGWGLSNRSAVGSGRATWYYHQRDTWNPINDPPGDFGRWWSMMFEGGYGGRVKNLTSLAGASFTVETVAAWRFTATQVASNPSVTFTEKLSRSFASFANPSGTGNGHHQIVWHGPMTERSASVTINLVSITDIQSPCR